MRLRKILDAERRSRIEYCDKSANKAGIYYVTCEGSRNDFFAESDM